MLRTHNHILTHPVKNSEVTFEDLYEEMSNNWPRKAQALQTRRWRALKREMKGGRV